MATDCFLKLDGIKGESTDDAHKEEIEISSWTLGASQQAMAAGSGVGGSTGGRVDLTEFSFSKVYDSASPTIFKYCCTGKHIPTVTMTMRGANETKETYLTYTLTDVVVGSISWGHGGDVRPSESISLRYAKIAVAYTPYDNAGKKSADIKAGWDTMANKAS